MDEKLVLQEKASCGGDVISNEVLRTMLLKGEHKIAAEAKAEANTALTCTNLQDLINMQ
jgi:hypothetical protein